MYQRDGSITIFMTFLFLLLFALTGTALDSARFFGSRGYVKASAYGAQVAMYGNYNRELYENYGLFAYGGYGGLGETDWCEEYKQILLQNLAERPEDAGQGGFFSTRYASVYQLGAIGVDLQNTAYLTEEKQFFKQVDAWLGTTAVKDITQKLLRGIQGTDQGKQPELLEYMEENSQVEQRREEQENAAEDGTAVSGKEAAEEETAVPGKNDTADKAAGARTEEGKNPLEFIRELLRDGVLALVCNEREIAETEVIPREDAESGSEAGGKDWYSKSSGTKILKGLLQQSDTLWNDEMLEDQEQKGKLFVYVSQLFASYVSEGGSSVPYGLEYMVTGKRNQKDAFAGVVNRLFLIRTLLNFLYVEKSPALQEESLQMATAIAAPLMAEAWIPAIQQGILLVLSLEEACVDICALLEGRRVPITKNQTNFKMGFGEICAANKALFQAKARRYEKLDGELTAAKLSKGIGYVHYLWLMLLMEPWQQLYQRTLDVIQHDLRERYNQTFTLDRCICGTETGITYGMPMLSGGFWIKHIEHVVKSDQQERGTVTQRLVVSYCYQ